MITTSILPMKEFNEGSFDPKAEMLGSGPFMVEEHLQDESWTLARHPRFWRQGYPIADAVKILIIPDDNSRNYERPWHPYSRALRVSIAEWERETFELRGEIAAIDTGGCPLSQRCPWAIGRCHVEAPALRELADGFAACHRAEEVARARRIRGGEWGLEAMRIDYAGRGPRRRAGRATRRVRR